MKRLDRITVDPEQCGGRPCIRGMRMRVKDILGLLAAGVAQDIILKDYPYLEPEDIQAALEFKGGGPKGREDAELRIQDSGYLRRRGRRSIA